MAISSTSGKNPVPKGRPKGTPNKITNDIRRMILLALDQRGGVEYLRGLKDSDFVRLVARVVPQEVDAKMDGNITVVVKKFGEQKI